MTKSKLRIVRWMMLRGTALLLCGLPVMAQDNPQPTLSHATAFGVTEPLGELAKIPQPSQYGFRRALPLRRVPKPSYGQVVDTAEGNVAFPSEFSIVKNFLGLGNGFPGFTVGGEPPDANLAVGDTQVLQWVNASLVVCDKGTAMCGAAVAGNTLWRNGIPGTLCANNNDGDNPLAQFDRKADRWVLSQNVFVSPYAVCIAVSTSNDANGSYFVYQFPVPGNGFPDYPKIGIWSSGGSSDGYFQAMNNFGPGGSGFVGPQICGYHRMKLLAGDPSAEQICFQLTSGEDSLLPGDADSPSGPPPAQDEFYIGSVADVDNSHLSFYSFHITTWNPAVASITGSPNTQLVTVASYSGSCHGSFGGDCVPQLGTSSQLDSLGDRLMYRFAYWNDPASAGVVQSVAGQPHQHWFVNGAVESSGGQIGVRWYEFRAPKGIITAAGLAALPPFQQETYAGTTGDSNYRWMGSLTRDNQGDILLGYSESSSTIRPAIGLAGRKASDPLSQLSDEVLVPINNNGSQTSSPWGEYSSMRIDPVDNCTFWYTTEYYMVVASLDWSTQIVSASFPNCH